jgi:competence ComEA-like helix-hairpin-helix protein
MDRTSPSGGIAAAPAPPRALGIAPPLRDITVAWPRCAQLAAAFLLGIAAALLGVYAYGTLQSGAQPAAADGATTLGYRVDLNTATRGELLQLPGIGPSLAERIEDYRRAHHGFTSVDELQKVSGIGPAILERLRPLVCVRPLPPADADKDLAQDKPAPLPKQNASKSVKKPAPPGLVDVNTASLAELQQLPGIGPKKAQNIIDARTTKPFTEHAAVCPANHPQSSSTVPTST